MAEGVYLSSADGQRSPLDLEDPSSFEHDLLLSSFFRPPVVIPDVFFFISQPLRNHVMRGGDTFIDVGLRAGLIVPAFRTRNTKTFRQALEVMMSQSNEQRKLEGLLRGSWGLADQLDDSLAGAASQPRFMYWPPDIGVSFEETIIKFLQRKDRPGLAEGDYTPEDRATLLDDWKCTEDLRHEVIDQASALTQTKIGKGLRRGDILQELGRRYEAPWESGIRRIETVMSHIPDPREAQRVSRFWRWVCECYHYNQSKRFGVSLTCTRYNPFNSVVPAAVMGGDPKLIHRDDTPSLLVDIRFPEPSMIRRVPPSQLITAVNTTGKEYFIALKDWQNRPGTATAQEVRKAAREYANHICSLSKQQRISSVLRAVYDHIPRPGRSVLKPLVKIGSVVYRPLGALLTVLDIGASLSELIPGQSRTQVIEVQPGRP